MNVEFDTFAFLRVATTLQIISNGLRIFCDARTAFFLELRFRCASRRSFFIARAFENYQLRKKTKNDYTRSRVSVISLSRNLVIRDEEQNIVTSRVIVQFMLL